MNDAIRAAVNARLHEKHMSRSDLARATGLRPQAVTRALNGGEGGGSVPSTWAAMLDALGLALVAVPVEQMEGGGQVSPAAPGDDLQARITAAVREALTAQAAAGQAAEGDGGSAGGQP